MCEISDRNQKRLLWVVLAVSIIYVGVTYSLGILFVLNNPNKFPTDDYKALAILVVIIHPVIMVMGGFFIAVVAMMIIGLGEIIRDDYRQFLERQSRQELRERVRAQQQQPAVAEEPSGQVIDV